MGRGGAQGKMERVLPIQMDVFLKMLGFLFNSTKHRIDLLNKHFCCPFVHYIHLSSINSIRPAVLFGFRVICITDVVLLKITEVFPASY